MTLHLNIEHGNSNNVIIVMQKPSFMYLLFVKFSLETKENVEIHHASGDTHVCMHFSKQAKSAHDAYKYR